MATVTVRPNSTVQNGDTIVAPSGTRQAALDDSPANDATDVQFSGSTYMILGFPDPTIPAGALVKQVAVRVRALTFSGAALGLSTIISTTAGGAIATNTRTVYWTAFTTWAVLTKNTSVAPTGIDVWISQSSGSDLGALLLSELYFDTVYIAKPAPVVSSPTGTLTESNRPPIVWTSGLDSDGGAQSRYEVKVFDDATYGGGGFDPDTSTPDAESGILKGITTTWTPDDPLANDTYKVYIRNAQTVNGELFWGDWQASSAFTVNVTLPAEPTIDVAADDANGRISIDLEDPLTGDVSTDLMEVQFSTDGGVTWE